MKVTWKLKDPGSKAADYFSKTRIKLRPLGRVWRYFLGIFFVLDNYIFLATISFKVSLNLFVQYKKDSVPQRHKLLREETLRELRENCDKMYKISPNYTFLLKEKENISKEKLRKLRDSSRNIFFPQLFLNVTFSAFKVIQSGISLNFVPRVFLV